MFLIFIIIIIVALLYSLRNVRIKWRTFFKKGFLPKRGKFGIYCYCGKQGSGKTYSVVEFLKENSNFPIYANLKSLKGIKYEYFHGLDQLLNLRDKSNCIIIYDEIFTILSKNGKNKITEDVMDFLSQMRKRGIIFITTAQEWLEIPVTFRRYCRYQIDCSMKNFIIIGLLIKHFYDAEQMKWSNEDNDFVAPLLQTTISKCQVSVANSYDTFEQIHS